MRTVLPLTLSLESVASGLMGEWPTIVLRKQTTIFSGSSRRSRSGQPTNATKFQFALAFCSTWRANRWPPASEGTWRFSISCDSFLLSVSNPWTAFWPETVSLKGLDPRLVQQTRTAKIQRLQMCRARREGPWTLSSRIDANLDCVFVQNTLFFRDWEQPTESNLVSYRTWVPEHPWCGGERPAMNEDFSLQHFVSGNKQIHTSDYLWAILIWKETTL